MSEIRDGAEKMISGSLIAMLIVTYISSLPLAIIFGDKWDVVIALVVPTYGFWVMLSLAL